ncbi:MAG: acetoacetate decarboxylase family protein [Gordonia sp. (in: high G+C Gram-positive bacteria)]|uniref:acetoacetate decarboxylase family protein n=1 Tax=Gordonia sp. (in: high G+C Gram-positive bacteria) TaxID=84139 RepID=UPI003BB55890
MTHHEYEVSGQTVTLPVQIRHARCFVGAFTADAIAIATAIAAAGDPLVALRPIQVRPGRGLCMLVFIDYVDGDLGPYHEFGVCFPVTASAGSGPGSSMKALFRGDARAVVHRLPVDGAFTLAAGREIWGFPKIMADFDVDHDSPVKRGRVSQDGALIADLTVRPGLKASSMTADTTLQVYSQLDRIVRLIPWQITEIGQTQTRIGGARLALGDHRIGQELAGLRLSRHALMSSSIDHLAMSFGAAEQVT